MKFLFITFMLMLIPSFTNADTTFTDDQVLAIQNGIRELQISDSLKSVLIYEMDNQIFSYRQVVQKDSIVISMKNQHIQLLNDRIDLYESYIKKTEPKWYETRTAYFMYGIGTTVISSVVVRNALR